MAKIGVNININRVKTDLLNAACARINRGVKKAMADIGIGTRQACEKAIKSQPEYTSLKFGDLKAQFGLIDISKMLDSIIDSILAEIYIDLRPFQYKGGNVIAGGLSIRAMKKDLSYLFNMRGASYKSNEYDIPWLEWLLSAGDGPIIFNWYISFQLSPNEVLRSRSGRAVMRPQLGARWSVPQQFAGTKNDNWITRAMDYAWAPTMDVVQKALAANIT